MKHKVPNVNFRVRELGEWVTKTSDDYFKGKRVVVFGLPGAFTPTCSSKQLPGYETKYNEIKERNIDEVYCISVNDSFVMNAEAIFEEPGKCDNLTSDPYGESSPESMLKYLTN
jgi:peroxiredoxin